MKKNILLSIVIVNVFFINIYSQKANLVTANKKYENFAYIDATKIYEKIAEKGYKSASMFEKLGNAYYFNGELDKAARWYKELFAMSETSILPTYYYRYAQTLRSIGENDKANTILAQFKQLSNDDSRAILFMDNINYLEEIKANSGRYIIENAGINSKYSDYGSSIYNSKLIFTSARDTGSLGQRKHSWTNQYFTNLYSAKLDENMNPTRTEKFDGKLKSRFNEATPTFTKDGKTVYFSRNNYLDGKKGKNSEGLTLIKLYKATLEGKNWTNISELPFDSDNYNTAHPTLSPDEKTLYFASDMPGTIGLSDIYKVQIKDDGSFGLPINLGPTINTEGRETFPFISDENDLYFASDGHPGLGGLDVFMSKIADDGSLTKVQNIGSDINSPRDDFAYIIDVKSRKGFYSSNKDGGEGYDDIYKFTETRKLTCKQIIYGKITDIDSKASIINSKITLFDSNMNTLNNSVSDQNGDYVFIVECGLLYTVRAEKKDYRSNEKQIKVDSNNGKTELDIALEKDQCNVTVGDDLGKCFGIKMIYFDFDKSNIREEAAVDLEKILNVLNQYPKMHLDIRSHTDSRGTAEYNEDLSERRAKSTIEWLIKNGISSSRLIGKGYGENKLVNNCNDAVACTEEAHQLNRRSEFIITRL
jgi:outer membrane protein OmpA-like peptidoglycan-associated protein/tetratricopeptide (TPR) repeat protein